MSTVVTYEFTGTNKKGTQITVTESGPTYKVAESVARKKLVKILSSKRVGVPKVVDSIDTSRPMVSRESDW